LRNRDIGCLRALTILEDKKIISNELKKELKGIMVLRNKIHLHKLSDREYGAYSDSMLTRAARSGSDIIHAECRSIHSIPKMSTKNASVTLTSIHNHHSSLT
jgi:hypothetical protein